MVFVVHLIEAYFLNPQIYSSKLKLHPLLVLVSLYITGEGFPQLNDANMRIHDCKYVQGLGFRLRCGRAEVV